MRKARRKRIRSRCEYLARLAENDPEKFRRQWAKRLESWSNLARRQANLLVDLRRRPVAACFQIARRAIEELAACGEAALARGHPGSPPPSAGRRAPGSQPNPWTTQCPGGTCPVGPPGEDWQPDLPAQYYPRPRPSVCRITCGSLGGAAGGTGTLVAKGDGWGAVLTCAHLFRGGVTRITARFPDGQTCQGRVSAIDETVDLAVVKITPRPKAPVAKIAGDHPQQGQLLWFAGYGPDGRYRVVVGRVEGYTTGHQGHRNNLVVTGSARLGDSGGPVLNAQGELVGVLWGTDGRRSMAVYNGQIYSFTALSDRYLFPWNADLAKEKYRWEHQQQQPGQLVPPQTQPVEPSGQLATIRAAVDGLRAEVTSNQKRLDVLEDVAQAAREAASRAETEAGRAIAQALDLDRAAQRVADQATEAQQAAGEATDQASQAHQAVQALDQGLIGRVTGLVKGLLGRYLGISFGGGGLLVGLLLWLVRKDILDRIQRGDPLLVERLAARTSTTLDDRVSAAAERIGERIAERLGWSPPQAGSAGRRKG